MREEFHSGGAKQTSHVRLCVQSVDEAPPELCVCVSRVCVSKCGRRLCVNMKSSDKAVSVRVCVGAVVVMKCIWRDAVGQNEYYLQRPIFLPKYGC